MILKCPNLYGAPGDAFDDAGQMLRAHDDHVADLKRPVGVKRDAGKEVAERVLQRETDDDAEDRGGGEQRAQINFRSRGV